MGLGIAVKAFFKGLFDAKAAKRLADALKTPSADSPPALPHTTHPTGSASTPSAMGDRPDPGLALVLLAELQKEGRLLDFLNENLEGVDDAAIGVAAREVHRGCQAALKRYVELEPVRGESEGATIQVPAGFNPAELRVIGTAGQPPFSGTLRHRGWRVSKLNVPTLVGDATQRMIVAPAEIEAK